jgi:hypothetical protein
VEESPVSVSENSPQTPDQPADAPSDDPQPRDIALEQATPELVEQLEKESE